MNVTRSELQFRLATARSGEAITYFIGDLRFERFTRGKDSQIEALAQSAWEAHLAGKCTLAQRRLGPSKYEYIAIKRPEPHRDVEYFGCYNREFLLGTPASYPKDVPHRVTKHRTADWLPSAPAGMH